MGRTRASAVAAEPASDSAGDGWAFRGAARSQGQEADSYSYSLIEGVDPDVYDLCIEYEVDDRKMRKLHQLMMTRIDTFESDILKLWDSVKNARSPSAVITTKMRDMENGTFIGKAPKRYYSEKPLKDFYKKHVIDNLCKDSLADALYDRRLRIIRERKLRGGGEDGDGFPEKDMVEILDKLSREIDGSRNPSALVMRHVPGIEFGTGSWEHVGQVQKCKEAPVEKQIELSKEELRAKDDKQAQAEENARRAKKEAAVAKSSKEQPKRVQKPTKGTQGGSKPANVPAFDSAELAKRLSEAAKDEPNDDCRSSQADKGEKVKASQAPAPPPQPAAPPVVAPPPEPIKRNMLPVKLSKKSLELVEKTSDGAKVEGGKAPDASSTAPALASTGNSKQSQEDDEDLEMAAIALGRPIAELRQLPQEEVRALVLASLDGGVGDALDGSASPSEGEDGEDAVEGFDGMSELEVASIALGRPIEELKRLPEDELRALVAGGLNVEPSVARASRSPSPKKRKDAHEDVDRKPAQRRSKSRDKVAKETDIKRRSKSRDKVEKEADVKRRSKSKDKAGKEADVKKRSRSNNRRRRGSASRSRSHRSAPAVPKHRRADSRKAKRETQSSKRSPKRSNSRSPRERRARRGSSPRKVASSPGRDAGRPSRKSLSRSRSRSHGRGRTRR